MLLKLPSSQEVRTIVGFRPAYSQSQQNSNEQHLDFVCPIPPACATTEDRKSSNGGSFLPSVSISGTGYVTRVTALRDRHLVQGSCQVIYWLEAEFWKSEASQLVWKVGCPVDVSSALTPLDVEISSADVSDRVEQIAKPQLRSLNRFVKAQPQPELSVRLPKSLGCVVSDSSRISTRCRRLGIPVAVTVALPSNSGRHVPSLPQVGTLKCAIKAQWYTKRAFTTGSPSVESVIHNDSTSTQEIARTLPPFYMSASSDSYSTSMDLDLLLPEPMSTPSISTDLLNISHTLNLSMKFEFVGCENQQSPYTANLTLPVTVQMTSPQSSLQLRNFDPILGYVDDALLFAPPPYIS